MTGSGPDPKRTGESHAAWITFVDSTASLRGDLHRYCRRMTRTVWDAEDLVQETMLRCFDHMTGPEATIRNPRAFMFRTATRVWIDAVRRRETELRNADLVSHQTSPAQHPAGAALDAGTALFAGLPPRERAALVLKEVIGLSLAEIAEVLETTTGAVKSALNRARTRVGDARQEEPGERPAAPRPSCELVDRFVAAFNALDVPALTELLLEDVRVEVVGIDTRRGRDIAARRDGWLRKSLFGHEPWALAAQQPARKQRAERHDYLGEPIVVVWMEREVGQNVEWLCRIEERDGLIAGLRDYCLCPETQEEVARALGLPVRPWGYRLSDEVLAWDGTADD
jgi:RNA polymerase sigma-70 factor (ECF subfamily)